MTVSDEDLDAWMAATFPCGTFVRRGVAVGFWRVREVQSRARRGDVLGKVTVAFLRSDGTPCGRTVDAVGDAAQAARTARNVFDRENASGSGGAREFLDAFLGVSQSIDVAGEPDALYTYELQQMSRAVERSFPQDVPVGRAAASARRTLAAQAPALEALAHALPADLVAFLRSRHGIHACLAPAWDGLVGEAPLLRAVGLAPHAWRLLIEAWTHDRARFRARLGEGRVDALVVEAARRLGALSPVVVGALGAADAAIAGATDAQREALGSDGRDYMTRRDVTWLVRGLDGLPGNWVPRDAEGWRSYVALRKVRSEAAHMACGSRGDGLLAALLDVRGDWTAHLRRLLRAAGAASPAELAGRLRDADDVALALASQLLVPALAIHRGLAPDASVDGFETFGLRRMARAMLYDGSSVARILERSATWHRRAAAIAAGVAALGGPARAGGWSAGYPGHSAGDLRLTVLTDVTSLVEEGADAPDGQGAAGLAHCVGGYGPHCLATGNRILSVRRDLPEGGFERLATLELGTRGEGGAVGLVQLRGRRNAEPTPEVRDLVASYLGLLLRGDLPIDREALAPVDAPASVACEAGYDWSAPGAWEAVLALWRPVLPRGLRDVTPGEVARSDDRDSSAHRGDGWARDRFVLAGRGPIAAAPPPDPCPDHHPDQLRLAFWEAAA